MKLLSKYNRVNIPLIIGAVLLSGIAYYFIIHYVLIHQLDKDLKIEEQEINDHVRQTGFLPDASTYKDQQIFFEPAQNKISRRQFSTEKIFDRNENEKESFRQLIFPVTINNSIYIATVRKSQGETEHLVQLIAMITLIVIAFLIIVMFIMNRFILGKLWKPFNSTLEQLKQFNISSKNKLQLNRTDINEFAELNKTVMTMTEKVSRDYETLKSFTENASHEIQTPLAIIKMKLELLMQSDMNAAQVESILALGEASDRLSRLNQSLLLLTKIDNSQFIENEPVNISDIITGYINNFEELTASKNIRVKQTITPAVVLLINKALAEALLANIMANTIKHNYTDGQIEVNLTGNMLTVSNTGKKPTVNTDELFERFKKDNASTESLGLGLAIVKKICDMYHFKISYDYREPMHTLNVNFDSASKNNS